jgi:hypothetical protein
MNEFNLYCLTNVDAEQMLNLLISDLSALSGSYGLRDHGP